jgi:CheY-like chemotaxis protein
MILVVDDDVDFLEQQQLQLAQAGYEVVTAQSRKEAQQVLAARKADLAIVDLMLEHADGGFALCHQIKRQSPATPVIIVTSVASQTGIDFDASTPEERSWLKADVTLAKPVRFEQLRREIERLLKE